MNKETDIDLPATGHIVGHYLKNAFFFRLLRGHDSLKCQSSRFCGLGRGRKMTDISGQGYENPK